MPGHPFLDTQKAVLAPGGCSGTPRTFLCLCSLVTLSRDAMLQAGPRGPARVPGLESLRIGSETPAPLPAPSRPQACSASLCLTVTQRASLGGGGRVFL